MPRVERAIATAAGLPGCRAKTLRAVESFARDFLVTHFFNPPRYLRLLEIIPTAETDPAVVAAITRFGDHTLGKGVAA